MKPNGLKMFHGFPWHHFGGTQNKSSIDWSELVHGFFWSFAQGFYKLNFSTAMGVGLCLETTCTKLMSITDVNHWWITDWCLICKSLMSDVCSTGAFHCFPRCCHSSFQWATAHPMATWCPSRRCENRPNRPASPRHVPRHFSRHHLTSSLIKTNSNPCSSHQNLAGKLNGCE